MPFVVLFSREERLLERLLLTLEEAVADDAPVAALHERGLDALERANGEGGQSDDSHETEGYDE